VALGPERGAAMRLPVSIALVLAVVGCHKAPQVEPTPYRVVGEYSYRMQVGPTPVEGEFSIEKDTVVLEAASHSCRRIDRGLQESPLSHSFRCGGGPSTFSVVVNSKQPTLSRWVSTESVTKSRQVCAKWAVTKEGTQYCASTRKEIYTEVVPISGRLEVTRIAAADKP
jgi:hypothetical protein